MKFSAVVFALGYLPGVHAEVCDDDQLCVPKGKPCTENPDECCQDLGCFGYPFYKKCQPPPYCLPEWYDCTVDIDCCDQFVCAENESGTKTCQEEEITTKTAPVPQAPSPPTSSPTPKNTEITKCPGDGPVRTSGACATGDPHITTFDGLKWDCMGHGEHIVLKSLISRRMIQGRYIQLATRKWSSMQAIAIQDEGDTPTVQVSKTVVDEGMCLVLCNLKLSHRRMKECTISWARVQVHADTSCLWTANSTICTTLRIRRTWKSRSTTDQ